MKRLLAALPIALLVGVATASAHVVVKPSTVNIGAFQIFDINVPNEKDNPVTGLRIVMPTGLSEVAATVKFGWTIETKKTGDNVTEIDWTNGSIPPEERDDFTFSAQAPANATTLQWKAYQTYQDGTVISWDQPPTNGDDAVGNQGPFSTTTVVDDLSTAPAPQETPLWLGITGVALGVIGIGFAAWRRPKM